MLAEAQKMFSNISDPSSDLGNSVGNIPTVSAEQPDTNDDDFLPPPPVALYTPAIQALSDPAPKSQPPAAEPAGLAQNWLRVAGTQQTLAKATPAEKPSTGETSQSSTSTL